jgi:lysozyme
MRTQLAKQLTLDEGVRAHVYKDHLGFDTIGIGRLVDSRKTGSGLRPVEIQFMFNNDLDDRIDALHRRLPWFMNLDDARRGVLLNMSFQMGVGGLLGFKNTLRMIEAGDYEAAAAGMMNSKWATQTPQRAQRLADQMRTGRWVYKE